jgi:hypothetical protein
MIGTEKKDIFVERAELAGKLRLRIRFNDGSERVVDFSEFLNGSANPLIREYLDPAAFARFTVKDGDVVWDDYDLCFPIADLYEGRI